MYTRRFAPLQSRARKQSILAFDVEGVAPGGFVCGSIATETEAWFFTDRQDMLAALLDRAHCGAVLVAHNAEYDLSVLTDGQLAGWELLYMEGRLLSAVKRDHHNHVWRVTDSRNLFPGFSVRQMGDVVGLPKLELPADLMDRISRITSWSAFSPAEQDTLSAYNIRDSMIVLYAVNWLQDVLLSLGGQLSGTIAGCAMDVFRRSYLKGQWDTPCQEINDFCRQAYYGARNEPLVYGQVQPVNMYDFISLYPSVQSTIDFPEPDYLDMEPSPRSFAQFDKRQGIADVMIDVPDTDIPPLPVRIQGRLFFPTGRLHGCWTLSEIRHALNHGCSLVNTSWVLSGIRSFNPFSDFINNLFSVRHALKDAGDAREKIIKFLLNASYGRYGIRSDNPLQRLTGITPDTDYSKLQGAHLVEMCGQPYAMVDLTSDYQPLYAAVILAAHISAGARIRLHQQMLLSARDTQYVDTDSVFTAGHLVTGDRLGDMRLEQSGVTVNIIGPKEYIVSRAGQVIDYRAKGIPRSVALEYLKEGHTTYRTPVTVNEAIRYHDVPGRWKVRGKRRGNDLPKRAFLAPLAGQDFLATRPWVYPELQQALAQWNLNL